MFSSLHLQSADRLFPENKIDTEEDGRIFCGVPVGKNQVRDDPL